MKTLCLRAPALLACVALACLWSTSALAQSDDDLVPATRNFNSPERLILELRVGPYQPDMGGNAAFDRLFAEDDGLLLALELDVIAFRLDDILYASAAAQLGWAKYKGYALDVDGAPTREESSLEIVPLSALAVLRLDAFARQLGIPFIVTGKVGYTWMSWSTETGGADNAAGWSLGLAYAAQLALDLDSLDQGAARIMDEEWGINHSFLFLEVHGFAPNDDSLPLGAMTWAMGLGFVM